MRGISQAVRIAGLALAVGALAACSATFRNHGYMPDRAEVEGLIVGVDTRDSVDTTIGEPGLSGIVDDSGWYYVRSRFRTYGWQEPEEVDREVLAISFNPEGTITNIETFGLENGNVVRLTRRVTTENTQGVGFLRQAFGNLGRVTADTLLGGNN